MAEGIVYKVAGLWCVFRSVIGIAPKIPFFQAERFLPLPWPGLAEMGYDRAATDAAVVLLVQITCV